MRDGAHTPSTHSHYSSPASVAGTCGRGQCSGVLVRLQGIDILCLTVYMACSIHLSGANVHRLNKIERIIKYFDIPFILGGGFNMEPVQFQEVSLGHTFLSSTDSQLLVPCVPTCTKSMFGRVIDFGIMSISLLPMLLANDVVNTPTVPHLGVVRLKREARQVRTCTLVIPKELPTPPAECIGGGIGLSWYKDHEAPVPQLRKHVTACDAYNIFS